MDLVYYQVNNPDATGIAAGLGWAMPPATNPIRPELFRFLRELERHNDRVWFAANKQRYFDLVRDPLLRFIAELAPRLGKVSKHVVVDPSPVGGSLFRIYRDTRFSKDKRPYKTHAAMAFRAGGGGFPAPAFYLHLGPGEVFAGAGIWHPETDTLKELRDAIVAQPARWQRAKRACPLDEDEQKLSRAPRGYDPSHPLVEDLKRKSFTTGRQLDERAACAADFPAAFAKICKQASPLMTFLSEAVGAPY
jgi:uncharacterized protein (TIGR02453 family)